MRFGSRSLAQRHRVVLGTSCLVVGVALWGPSPTPSSAAFGPLLFWSAEEPEQNDPSTEDAQGDDAPPAEWKLVMGRHWQLVGRRGEDPESTDAHEGNRGACPVGMVEVRGRMKQHPELDALQLRACTRFLSSTWPERCEAYDRDQWLAASKVLPTRPMAFCIDRFEYPNRKGEHPVVMVNFYEAQAACSSVGKRLCSEDEWTFACEGEEATPYVTGYIRDPEACVIDRPWKPFDASALAGRATTRVKAELDRLWQGVPSGSRPLCRSAFGVYDLTGNVDEWTRSTGTTERASVLKGGYWGPVRTRCRPATRAHDEMHSFYQQGFRCCADVAQVRDPAIAVLAASPSPNREERLVSLAVSPR
jgi:formylglycine-generating enzyme